MTRLPDAGGPFKLRVTSESGKGAWLQMLGVSQGMAPVQVADWHGVFRNRSQYKFTPHFVHDERGAFSFLFRDVAGIQQRILAEQQVETEIVAGKGSNAPK